MIVVGLHRRQFVDTWSGRQPSGGNRPVLMANAALGVAYQRSLLAIDLDAASQGAAQVVRLLSVLAGTDVTALHPFDAAALSMMKRTMGLLEVVEAHVKEEERHARMH